MPPAFNLSQDQTLQFNTCTRLHSLLTSTKPSAYAESFVTSPMTVTAIRPASFSMSTSRDAYRALESPATSHPPESPPASSRPPDTQGHHHPKYPHLSVVHVVKERARPGSSNNAGFGRAEGANYNDPSSTLQASSGAVRVLLPMTIDAAARLAA